jgi:hypothetical protein
LHRYQLIIMKTSTAYNHQRRLMNAMTNIYACAVYDRPSHRDLVARVVAQVWDDPGLKRCPAWVSHGLRVYRDQLSEQIYRHLRWGFMGSDGVIRASYLDLSPDDQNAVNRGDIVGHHYWLETSRKCETLPDGTMVETISRQFTHKFY